MRLIRVFLALMLGVAASLMATTANAEETATVSVLHAVPGATVDVYANGEALLTNFTPGTLTDPQELPAGSYDLKVVAQGAGADADAIMEAKGVTVPAGANLTVVAHLDADGKPKLSAFANDTSVSTEGSRLTVRHVAAAPAVDVRAGGDVAIANLANPDEKPLDLAAGTIKADVVAAGTDTVVLGPADVELKPGMNTIVYAWGSLKDENLALAIQTVELHKAGTPHTGASDQPEAPFAGFAVATLAGLGAIALLASRRKATARN